MAGDFESWLSNNFRRELGWDGKPWVIWETPQKWSIERFRKRDKEDILTTTHPHGLMESMWKVFTRAVLVVLRLEIFWII